MLMDPTAIFRHFGAVLIITIVTVLGKVFSITLWGFGDGADASNLNPSGVWFDPDR